MYRAWSHWRALAGGKHIRFLIANSLLSLDANPTLSSIYPPLKNGDAKDSPVKERLLITQNKGRELVKALEIPELEVELERAIWQVENDINKEKQEPGEEQVVVPHPKEKDEEKQS